MKTRTITACVIFAMLFCLASGAFAAAPKLTVGSASICPGASGTVNITVDNAAGITGAAFTLTYDTAILDITVSSDFFGTFTEQGFDAADGLTDGKVDGFDSPVVTNEVSGTGMRIAAANATPATSGTNVTLFTLNVTVSDTAAEDSTYDINITATTLNNTAAGYDAAGEQIDLLIEAKADGTFASLLPASSAAASVTKGTITAKCGNIGDLVVDKVVDIFDVLAGVDAMGTNLEAADLNGDGSVDIFDVLAIVDLMGTTYTK
jgi:hypothetical protein